MSGARRRLSNTALVLASLAFTLGALECGARVARRAGGSAQPGTELRDYNEYDPVLGWRKRPGLRIPFHRPEYDVELAINSLGLRDPERGYEVPPGVSRILALGDSYVEGYTVPLDRTVTQVLERSLQEAGCRVEVINGATTGYSTDQEYLFYQTEGVKYGPRLVLLFFYYNDVLANDRQFSFPGTRKPVFVFREGRFEVYRTPVPPPPSTLPAPRVAAADEDDEEAGSALLEWVKERLWFGAPRAYNALGRSLRLWEPNRPLGARLELWVYKRARNREIAGGWEKTAAILDALNREVEANGARLLVVYVPARFEVSERSWQASQARYGMDDRAWDRRQVLRLLEQLSPAPVLDLTPALRAEEERLFGGAYYPRDGHWNARGHEVAASAVQTHLERLGWMGDVCEPTP